MNEQLGTLVECPCCKTPTEKAKVLFPISILGESCLVVQCPKCTLIYKNQIPTKIGLQNIYSDNYVHFDRNTKAGLAEINSAKQKLSRCQKLLTDTLKPKDLKLLDIGCGSGMFVNIARSFGYFAEGIDPYLPEDLHSNYLHQKSPDDIPKSSYDIAVLLNVAEHLDQPQELFQAILKLLKPDGVMLLTCPYGNSLARRFHQSQWGHLALDEHLLFWNPYALTYLLCEIGFQGKFSYRISGSPFPYGRVKNIVNQVISVEQNVENSHSCKKVSIQGSIWQAARCIQKHEAIANLVRSLVHITHTGDYLEYAICVSRSH